MRYFLGVDGGGTKTAFLLTDEEGKELARAETSGCSYRDIGMEQALSILRAGVCEICEKAKIMNAQIESAAAGIPCFGESKENDAVLACEVPKAIGAPCLATNDVRVGWAGSLQMKPGINVVAGTGSIAYGEDGEGRFARCGGWSSFFGDEGSCCWTGRRAMEYFSKEADGRLPRGALYDIIMKKFDLHDPMEFIDRVEGEYTVSRDKTADFNRILLLAAEAGDECARELYARAAEELFSIVKGVSDALHMTGKRFDVSYSGGLFHASRFVLPELAARVSSLGGRLCAPLLSPVEGAALLARAAKNGASGGLFTDLQ